MKQNALTPWQRLIGLLALDKRDIKQLFYYAIFAGLVTLSLPLGIQAIINLIQGAQVSTAWVVLVVLVTLGVAFQGILQLMQVRILENIQQKIFTRSSFEFAYRFPKIKLEELRNVYPPELANRFFDTLTVQKGLSKILIDFPAAALQILFGLILLSLYHPFFILYGIMLVALIYFIFKFTAKKGLETSLFESQAKYKVAHWIQEIARSNISFKLSGKTELAMQRNDQLTTEYLEYRERHFRVLVSQFIQLIGFKVMVTAGLLVVGGILVLNQQLNIGQFVAAEIIILLVIGSIEKLIVGLETFYDVLTSLEKIGIVTDKELENQEGVDPFSSKETLHIETEDLGFTTPEGKVILKDINLEINPQDRVLLQGPSGSGKTSLLKLMAGIMSPTSGVLFINNASIKGIHVNKYRAQIGQVLTEQSPFEGTILENITFGNPNISEEAVHDTIVQLNLQGFIKAQENGLQTIIYPEGKQLSQTVSRKLVIARAIVHKPKLLILRDPLEHFEETEAKQIINYLTSPERPWALIITSRSGLWKSYCNKELILVDGQLKSNTSNNA